VDKVGSTLSRVHIRAKNPIFQSARVFVKVSSGSQFDEFDNVPPALGDLRLLNNCATDESREGGILMATISLVFTVVNAFVGTSGVATARVLDGEVVAFVAFGSVIVSAMGNRSSRWAWPTLGNQCSIP
jgi:hypothetical protein